MNTVRLPMLERVIEDGVERCRRCDTGEVVPVPDGVNGRFYVLVPTKDGTVQVDHLDKRVHTNRGNPAVVLSRWGWNYSQQQSVRLASFCYLQ
ncbi:MAG: hypothetical protein Q7S06_02540 [Nanoarchaeota archaeon]|nr:hypothetical protein [Nanoarchaeota archaeon]